MKTFIFLFSIIFLPIFINAQCPTPTVVSPDGGEVLIAGESYEVAFNCGCALDYFIDKIYLYYSLDSGENWNFIDTIGLDSVEMVNDPIVNYTWTVPDVESNNCIFIASRFEANCWDESDNVFSISGLSSTSKTAYADNLEWSVFPNPVLVHQQININVESKFTSKFELSLINIHGIEVQSFIEKASNFSIQLDQLDAGIYILILKHEGFYQTKRLVVQ